MKISHLDSFNLVPKKFQNLTFSQFGRSSYSSLELKLSVNVGEGFSYIHVPCQVN